jgi:Ala-tRNA(Pro) deacylase
VADPEAAEAALFARLESLGIGWERHAHPPLRTVEESRVLRGAVPGAHCKNLFLKARKGGFWLAVCREDRRIRIPDIARAAGIPRCSFGSAEDLAARLGVAPGAVTPLALINDPTGEVGLILDAQMMAGERLNCHPLRNDATVTLATADLRRFFEATGHAPVELDFDALERLAADAQAGD